MAQTDTPEVRAGDAVEDLAATIALVADQGHPVVLNTWVLNYLSEAQRLAYVAELDRSVRAPTCRGSTPRCRPS